jgi:transposase
VDWGHLGTVEMAGQEQKLHGFTFTLGYSRRMVAEAALDQKLGTLLRCTKPRSSSSAECRKRFSTTA